MRLALFDLDNTLLGGDSDHAWGDYLCEREILDPIAYKERNDAEFLKATIATYDAASDQPKISYGPVDTSLIPPRARTYGKKDDAPTAAKPAAQPAATAAGV